MYLQQQIVKPVVIGTPHNKLLTPKVEYYRNLVDQYKKSLDSLNTGPSQSLAVKHTLEFMNRQSTLRSMNLTGGSGDDKS